MPKSKQRIHIRKEAYKFAAAHMTVFSDGTKEALHGHNYTTEIGLEWASKTGELARAEDGQFIPFKIIKKGLKEICQEWDEKVLIPARSRHLKILAQGKKELEFLLCGKRYVLPADEVELLPLSNITTETLAMEFCRRYLKAVQGKEFLKSVTALEIKIEESPGQGASFRWEMK